MSNSNILSRLRQIGILLLFLGGAMFMLQGWNSYGSSQRLGSFLFLSIVLASAGVFCVRRWNEPRGGRTFLTLATATSVVHFSQLGAMVFSLFSDSPTQLPCYLTYHQESAIAVSILVALGLLFSIPISFLGFRILAPNKHRLLTSIFIFMNSLLLIPSRNPELSLCLIGLIDLTLLLLAFKDPLYTLPQEAKIARLVLFIPGLTLVLRTLMYSTSFTVVGCLFILISLTLFYGIRAVSESIDLRGKFELLSLLILGIGWLLMTIHAGYIWSTFPVFFLMIALSFTQVGKSESTRLCVSLLGVAFVFFNLSAEKIQVPFFTNDLFEITIAECLLGLSLIGTGWVLKEKTPFFSGILVTGLLLLNQIHTFIEILNHGTWVWLAVLGTSVILLDSYLERKGNQLTIKWSKLKSRFDKHIQ